MKNINRYIFFIVGIVAVGGIVYYFSDIVAYVLVAWVLSMIGQPLMRFFQRKVRIGKFTVGPNTSAALTLLIFILIASLLVYMFVPLIVEQANNLATVDYAAIANALAEPIQQLNDWAADMGIVKSGKSPSDQVQEALSGWFEPNKIGNLFSSALGFAGNFLIAIFSILFITFFFLKENRLFVNFLTLLVPKGYEYKVKKSMANITTMLTRYFGGITAQVTIITLMVSIALSIVGVKNALLIGFFAALIYIFSNSVLAHPLEIFLVILIGGKLGGIVGMILAIPAYTVLRVIASVFLSEFKIVQQLNDRMRLEERG